MNIVNSVANTTPVCDVALPITYGVIRDQMSKDEVVVEFHIKEETATHLDYHWTT